MISGLVVVIPRYDELQFELMIHVVLVSLLAVGFVLYTRYRLFPYAFLVNNCKTY